MADIAWTVQNGAAIVTLNRPEKRNALTLAMWRALPEALAAAARAPGVRALVLTGAGGHFASGADIVEFETTFATRAAALESQAAMAAAFRAVEDFPLPTLAMIRGACVGGGCGLALACDLRFADESARFAIPPAKLGLAYLIEDTRRLVAAVGLSAAKDMLFTGRILGAEEALAIGLIDRAVPAPALEGAVGAYLAQVAAASSVSARATKTILRRITQEGATLDDEASRTLFVEALESADFAEGRQAFLEKRPPRFS